MFAVFGLLLKYVTIVSIVNLIESNMNKPTQIYVSRQVRMHYVTWTFDGPDGCV